jgi:hypothetical protein
MLEEAAMTCYKFLSKFFLRLRGTAGNLRYIIVSSGLKMRKSEGKESPGRPRR